MYQRTGKTAQKRRRVRRVSARRHFGDEIRRNARRLRLTLFAYFLLALCAGHLAGQAFQFTVDPDAYYLRRYGVGLYGDTEPRNALFGYVNQVTLAALLLAWVQYRRTRRHGDETVLSLVNARPLTEQRLLDSSEEMAIAAGTPPPRVWIVESADLNAFSCAPAGGPASIALTRGLLECLTREQIQGVVAHEMAHIRNGDARLATMMLGLGLTFHVVAAVALGPLFGLFSAGSAASLDDGGDAEDAREAGRRVPGFWEGPITLRGSVLTALALPLVAVSLVVVGVSLSLVLYFTFAVLLFLFPWLVACYALWDVLSERVNVLAEWAQRRRRKMRYSPVFLLVLLPAGLVAGPAILILGIVVPLMLLLMRLSVSRNREYQADATAVQLTRNPGGLRGALETVRAAAAQPLPGAGLPGVLNLITIAGSRRARSGEELGNPLLQLFSTHPPLQSRIERLTAMETLPLTQ